jgi:sugar phosphate isomerase/epimerase
MFDYGLGASITGLTEELSLSDIDVLGKCRISTFELNPRNFTRDYDRSIRGRFKTMLQKTAKRAVSYHVPFAAYDDISAVEEDIRQMAVSRLRVSLADAVYFNCELLVVHPSTEPISLNPERRQAHIRQLRKSMAELEQDLIANNLTMALENLPRSCMGNTLDEIRAMLEDTDPAIFSVCLDVNHVMERYRELPDMIMSLKDRLKTLHISDYDGVDERHWAPGTGVINWQEVLQALDAIDYRGPFNYELAQKPLEEQILILENNFEMMQKINRGG